MTKQAAKAPCLSTNKAGQRCSFTTKAGRPCRAWPVHGSEPPACSSHLRASLGEQSGARARSRALGASLGEGLPEPAGSRHLGSSLSEGVPEPAGSRSQGSASGESAPEPGFYDHTLTDEELADLVIYAAELTLDDEIACTRIAVRRTLEFLNQRSDSPSDTEYLRAAGLVFQGARTIARLLREQQALSGGSDSRFQEIMDAALDGLSEEWGIEL